MRTIKSVQIVKKKIHWKIINKYVLTIVFVGNKNIKLCIYRFITHFLAPIDSIRLNIAICCCYSSRFCWAVCFRRRIYFDNKDMKVQCSRIGCGLSAFQYRKWQRRNTQMLKKYKNETNEKKNIKYKIQQTNNENYRFSFVFAFAFTITYTEYQWAK